MSSEQKKNPRGGARLQPGGAPSKPPKPPKKRGSSAWARLPTQQKVLRIAFLVLTVIAAVIVAGFVLFHLFSAPPDVSVKIPPRPQVTTVIDEQGNEIEVEVPGLSAGQKKEFYTFLLVGQDTFGGGNTDTMMLASYDVPNQQLNVMSLPRDTFVSYRGRNVLLNSVYNRAGGGEDGIEALKQEVGELTGVTPNFYVIVQWEAVGKLVDAIEGVEFEVPFDMYYNDLSQDFKINLKKGYQLLDGNGAMGLLRWRHNSIGDTGRIDYSYGYAEGDIGRIRTQQAFLKAVVAKCLQPSVLLPNLTEYLSIFMDNVVTDLTVSNIAYFAKSAVGSLDMENVEFITMPFKSAGDGAHVLPIGSELLELVNTKFNPYPDDIRLSELKLVTAIASPSTPAPPPADTPEPSETVPPAPDETSPPSTGQPQPGETGAPEPGGTASPPASQPPSTLPPEPPPAVTAPPAVEPTAPPAVQPTPPAADPFGPGMEPLE